MLDEPPRPFPLSSFPLSYSGSTLLVTSDFPARLGLKAGSAAQLLEASGLSNSKPEPVFQASEGLGLVMACKPRLPGLIRLMNNELCVT